jgi:CRISPR-associated endonuclease Csn1
MANNTNDVTRRIWSFDIGTGSLGEAVRDVDGISFLHRASWLIPEKLAQRGPAEESGTPASRYRAMKTREAHLAREARLRTICAEAGIEVLLAKRTERNPKTKKFHVVQEADPRLTREFPVKGDETCYTSCLLRIKLVRGDKLEGWQIFKALHSAIQRRGYDANLAWKNRPITKPKGKNKNEDGDTAQSTQAFRDALSLMAPGQDAFHLPCYFDAWRMELWNTAKPDELRLRVNHLAEPARNRDGTTSLVAPRDLVVNEARLLVEAAAKFYPKLTGRTDEILFGPGAIPYASYYPALRKSHNLRLGGANDWEGILGQKVPRFDNRIIAKCALIPRLNACSAVPRKVADNFAPDSLLAAEVTFLMKLKNANVLRDTGELGSLDAIEVATLFQLRHNNGPTNYGFSEKQWTVALESLGLRRAPGHDEISKPNLTGRSRFCRPALRILRELLLSCRSPIEQHSLERAKLAGNTNLQRGLVVDDLSFLLRMGGSWSSLYIPDQKHDYLLALRKNEGSVAAIRALISSCNNPIVRHRLEVLWERLRKLEKGSADNMAFGVPDEVVLEFVRQDFMGEDAKQELQRFQNERAKARETARNHTANLTTESRSAALKYELLVAQGGICLYTGQTLAPTDLDELRFEHIVPRAQGGPDAIVNYVVTTSTTNDAKGIRTPYEWFMADRREQWDAYVARVNQHATTLRAKKVRLLTQPDAAEQVRRYTSLAETAYIAKLAQTLVALHFDWPINSQSGARRITIVSGGLTARIRRKYKLNSLLKPCPEGKDLHDWEEQCEKNRDDDRHHALDAMVISFIPGWSRDPAKESFFRLPKAVSREIFATELEKTFARRLAYDPAVLSETAYALRAGDNGAEIITKRVKLASLAYKSERMKQVFSPATARKNTPDIRDTSIRKLVDVFIAQDFNETAWNKFCDEIRVPRSDGTLGPRVKKISVYFSEPGEYKDLSKDGSGMWRKGFAEHRGQFVFLDAKGKFGVCPVYAFESSYQVRERLSAKGLRILMFLQSGCMVETTATTAHDKQPLPAGIFLLKSIRGNTDAALNITKTSYVTLALQDGTTYRATPKIGQRSIPLYPLSALINAGFRRID